MLACKVTHFFPNPYRFSQKHIFFNKKPLTFYKKTFEFFQKPFDFFSPPFFVTFPTISLGLSEKLRKFVAEKEKQEDDRPRKPTNRGYE